MIDEYEDNPGRAARDKRIVSYSQVQCYVHVTLPAEPRLNTKKDSTAILALVTLCKTNGKDASSEPVWYEKMETVRAFSVTTIDCVIGQIKVGNRWGIIDRSYGSQRAMMHELWEPEYESEDDNNCILYYFIFYYCSSSGYMFYIKLLSPLQVADLVETHRLLGPVLYQLPDPVGPHQFTQPVIAGSLT